MRYQDKLQHQLRAIALIGDFSLWCMNMANKGGDLGDMHHVHLYRLAEALTSLRWSLTTPGVDPADIRQLLDRLETIADEYPAAFKLREGVRSVGAATLSFLA